MISARSGCGTYRSRRSMDCGEEAAVRMVWSRGPGSLRSEAVNQFDAEDVSTSPHQGRLPGRRRWVMASSLRRNATSLGAAFVGLEFEPDQMLAVAPHGPDAVAESWVLLAAGSWPAAALHEKSELRSDWLCCWLVSSLGRAVRVLSRIGSLREA